MFKYKKFKNFKKIFKLKNSNNKKKYNLNKFKKIYYGVRELYDYV